MTAILAALIGVLATLVASVVARVPAEVDRRDRLIAERDEQLEEWVIAHHRRLLRDFRQGAERANAQGTYDKGTLSASRTASRTLKLYEYREELLSARSFVLGVEVEERFAHRAWRRLRKRPFPQLKKPDEAEPIIAYWQRGTDGNALTWKIADIIASGTLDKSEP